MKKLCLPLMCLTLFLNVNTFSQDYKFGKVSKEELQETVNPNDSSANATVLYEKRRVYFEYNEPVGFELITEVHRRIKIYNQEGYDHGTHSVSLFKRRNNNERVNDIKAYTFILQEGEIVKTKLKSDGIFKTEISKNYNQFKFTMPAIKPLAVLEYKYKVRSPFYTSIDRIPLQYSIPVKNLQVQVSAPEYFNFKKFSTGYLPLNIKESSKNDRIRIGSNHIDHVVNINTITQEDIPAFNMEPFTGNYQNYISSISFELSFTNFPNATIEYFSTSWEDVIKNIYNSSSFGGELKKKGYFEKDIDPIISDAKDESSKIIAIYNFVKKKMKWNGNYGVGTSSGVKKSYKEGVGNSGAINLMLISMLSHAGIQANPILVTTADRPISLFPTLEGLNYVICRARLVDGTVLYLDATDKYAKPNVLPRRVMQGMGRVISKKGDSEIVSLRPQKNSNSRYMVQCKIENDGLINGRYSSNEKNYKAYNYRKKYVGKDEEILKKNILEKYSIDEIDEYSQKGMNEFGKGITEKFNFSTSNEVEAIGDELFFSPLIFLRDSENIFKSEDRKYPVDFGFGYNNSYMVSIDIPKGYDVQEIPQNAVLKLPDNLGSLTYQISTSNNLIQLVVREVVNSPVLTVNYYPALKEFYNQLIKKENEQIVLKKI